MKTFRPEKKRIEVSVGESVRILRELQGHSQGQLSRLTGFDRPRSPQSRTTGFDLASNGPKSWGEL